MHWAIEPTTTQEPHGWKKHIVWFEFRILEQTRRDRDIGKAEVGNAESERAWTLNWCYGSPSGDPLHISERSRELDNAVEKVLKSLRLDDWLRCHEIPRKRCTAHTGNTGH